MPRMVESRSGPAASSQAGIKPKHSDEVAARALRALLGEPSTSLPPTDQRPDAKRRRKRGKQPTRPGSSIAAGAYVMSMRFPRAGGRPLRWGPTACSVQQQQPFLQTTSAVLRDVHAPCRSSARSMRGPGVCSLHDCNLLPSASRPDAWRLQTPGTANLPQKTCRRKQSLLQPACESAIDSARNQIMLRASSSVASCT